MVWRVLKALLVLAVAAFLGLAVYAYLGDITPAPVRVTKPVVLDAD